MSRWAGVTVLGAAVAVMTLGCAQGPSATAAVVENKTYTVTPASVTVKAGIITGEVTEPVVTFSAYGGGERLDPGQDGTQSLDVHFPAEALKAKKLKEIRLELAYIPSPYREESINFTVSIGAGQ